MLKKVFVAITLAVCFTGLSFSTGCSSPGEVQEGTATNSDFGKSKDKDQDGIEAPDGLGIVD